MDRKTNIAKGQEFNLLLLMLFEELVDSIKPRGKGWEEVVHANVLEN